VGSLRLHLAAEGKVGRTLHTYTEAVRWFAAGHLLRETDKTVGSRWAFLTSGTGRFTRPVVAAGHWARRTTAEGRDVPSSPGLRTLTPLAVRARSDGS
jgi:hypothetical protein